MTHVTSVSFYPFLLLTMVLDTESSLCHSPRLFLMNPVPAWFVGCPQVAQTFYITIKPVDDSLPLLQVPGMRVQEGVRKTITEFELKATDADTEVKSISVYY